MFFAKYNLYFISYKKNNKILTDSNILNRGVFSILTANFSIYTLWYNMITVPEGGPSYLQLKPQLKFVLNIPSEAWSFI